MSRGKRSLDGLVTDLTPQDETSRRVFLRRAALTAGAFALSACGDRAAGSGITGPLLSNPLFDKSEGDEQGRHVRPRHRRHDGESIVRSLPRLDEARRRTPGRACPSPTRMASAHPTHALAPDFQGCGFADPDHSFTGARVEYNNGMCDGWLRAGHNDDFSIGYYSRTISSFSAAPPSTGRRAIGISRRYWARRSRIGSTCTRARRIASATRPTSRRCPRSGISLANAGLSGQYYFSDLPFLGLWGSKYTSISHPIADFFAACQTGALPNVSYIDPVFSGEGAGTSIDDHPHADIRAGEAFLQRSTPR